MSCISTTFLRLFAISTALGRLEVLCCSCITINLIQQITTDIQNHLIQFTMYVRRISFRDIYICIFSIFLYTELR
jgi:hypothetical protein